MTYSSGRQHSHRIPLIATLVALALGATGSMAGPSSTPASTPPKTGDSVTLFPVPDLDGRLVDPGLLVHGRAALIAMWASWCQPCISEIPRLRELARTYRDRGLVVLGVGLEQGMDTPAKQLDVAARQLINYQLLFDAKREYQTAYALSSLPFSILVGQDGKIRWQGAILPEDLDARVRVVLGEIPAAGSPGG